MGSDFAVKQKSGQFQAAFIGDAEKAQFFPRDYLSPIPGPGCDRRGLQKAVERVPAASCVLSSGQGCQFPERGRIAGRDIGIIGIGADVLGNSPGTSAFLAFGECRHDADGSIVLATECVRRTFPEHHLDVGGDADLGKIEIFKRIVEIGAGDIDDRRRFRR